MPLWSDNGYEGVFTDSLANSGQHLRHASLSDIFNRGLQSARVLSILDR